MRPAGRSGAEVEESGARGSAVKGAAGFGWVAAMRETGKRPEPPHCLAPDPSKKGPVAIPSERAMNRVLLSKPQGGLGVACG